MLVLPFSDIAVEIVEDSPFATSDNLFNEEKIFLSSTYKCNFLGADNKQ